jgi:hypothetical protein
MCREETKENKDITDLEKDKVKKEAGLPISPDVLSPC